MKSGFAGDAFFVGFRPKTNAWLSVEASSDLHNWTTLACVATTNDVTEFVDANEAALGKVFYRLRQPGTSVDEAEAGWLRNISGDYRFHLQRVRWYWRPAVLDADVTVQAGKKQVTNVQSAGEQPDPGDFPTIPELFGLLREAQQSGCWRVAVVYDQAHGFPSWFVIERLAERFKPKQIDIYAITGFAQHPWQIGHGSRALAQPDRWWTPKRAAENRPAPRQLP